MVERRVISLGGIHYEVRPMGGVLQGFEIWRGGVELGFFVVEEGGMVDDAVMRLVAEADLAPPVRT